MMEDNDDDAIVCDGELRFVTTADDDGDEDDND